MFKFIKTIFFDVGDTLYVSPEMEKEYPRKLVELIAKTRNIELSQAKEILSEVSKKHVTKVHAMEELGFSRAQTHEAFCKVKPEQFITKNQQVSDALTAISKRYDLGVISNFKLHHLQAILSAIGLSSNLFRWFITEDIVQEIKPAPEPFLKAIEMSALRPSECLFVGDSPLKDMKPAKDQGMLTVLIKKNPQTEDLKFADAHIENIQQLSALLL